MIKKLRIKFVVYTLLSVFLFLSVILSTINIVSFVLVTNSADDITQMIANEDAHADKGTPAPKEGQPPKGPESPDIKNSMRYFTYRFDKNNKALLVSYHLNSHNENQCLEWAKSLSGRLGTGWSKTYYRYRVYTSEVGRYVMVVDQTRELKPTCNVLYASLIGGFGGLILAGVISYFLSIRLVKPLVESENKETKIYCGCRFSVTYSNFNHLN